MPTEARFSARASGPYVQDFYSITLDLSANTGQIEFNGYFYKKTEELPIESWLTVFEPGPEIPTMDDAEVEEIDADMEPLYITYSRHDTLLHSLHVRITQKEEFEDTSEYWDEPGVGMMCAFPTNRLRLPFDILPRTPSPPTVQDLGGIETDETVEELE